MRDLRGEDLSLLPVYIFNSIIYLYEYGLILADFGVGVVIPYHPVHFVVQFCPDFAIGRSSSIPVTCPILLSFGYLLAFWNSRRLQAPLTYVPNPRISHLFKEP